MQGIADLNRTSLMLLGPLMSICCSEHGKKSIIAANYFKLQRDFIHNLCFTPFDLTRHNPHTHMWDISQIAGKSTTKRKFVRFIADTSPPNRPVHKRARAALFNPAKLLRPRLSVCLATKCKRRTSMLGISASDEMLRPFRLKFGFAVRCVQMLWRQGGQNGSVFSSCWNGSVHFFQTGLPFLRCSPKRTRCPFLIFGIYFLCDSWCSDDSGFLRAIAICEGCCIRTD